MSACGLQDTPTGVLSFFHPTPRRHRRPEKLDNRYDWNYTLKLPLSLIVTMHYAAVRNCRKCAFPGLPKVFPGRRGEDRPAPARLKAPPATATPIVAAKEIRSPASHPCFQLMKRNEYGAPPAQKAFVQSPGSGVPYSRTAPRGSRCLNLPTARSTALLDFRFLPAAIRVRTIPEECGSSA